MNETAVASITVLVVMGIADAAWLVTMTPRFYRRFIPDLLLEQPSIVPAIGFYLLYAVGVMVLVVSPALDAATGLGRVAGTGALLGAAAYGTYDLTNQATLKGWRWPVTVVDITWGASLTALVTTLAVAAARAWA
jgi:uncharacterized membrane protein